MSAQKVVTRFAPSPTGFLHIGGARTALFNWLFARRHGGTFLLRIEDTDRERSTPEATAAILEGMAWLGLQQDGEAFSQFERAPRHREVAEAMVANGSAYRCYATKAEIDAHREANPNTPFQSPWRDADPATAAADAPFTVRLKAPQTGETIVDDAVQGVVTFKNETMDDLILLRSDGTPTYMLAVVVDDHDMEVTHIIRGDDHLVNAARQTLIFAAMSWEIPVFAHIPLIHGPDGKKLSKRHGALGVGEYREMGYLPEAMRNYLARLGWSHGDEEFFTTEQATEWFGLDAIGKSAARFDFAKLEHINGLHMRAADDARLADIVAAQYSAQFSAPIPDALRASLCGAMPTLKERAKNVRELFDLSYYVYASRPLVFDEKASKQMNEQSAQLLAKLTSHLRDASSWSMESLEGTLKEFAESEGLKFGKVAQPLRAALTGRGVSPGVYDVMMTLGREETLARIEDQII